MATLKETLLTEARRPELITQCVALIDGEVKKKKGFKGVAIKGAYGTIKAIKRGFVPGVVDALLDDWIEKMEPHFASHTSAGGAQDAFSSYLSAHADEVAESLLSVTDERAETTKHKRAAKLYKKLRPGAKANVVDALPGLGEVIDGHLADAATA